MMKLFLDPFLIKTMRHSKHWSQEDLASISDLSVRTIQRMESQNGKQAGVSLETAKTLASVFEIDIKTLETKMQDTNPGKTPKGTWLGIAGALTGTGIGIYMSMNGNLIFTFQGLNEATSGGLGWGLFGLGLGICCALAGFSTQKLNK